MATLIERIKIIERNGEWAKVRRIGETWLTVATDGTSRARLHASLSTAYFVTATSIDDWRTALRHAHACNDLAEYGSDLHVYSLQRLSSLYADLGEYDSARRYALQYVALVGNRQGFTYYSAMVWRDLALIAYRRGDFRTSARLYRKAYALFVRAGMLDEASRGATNIAWALIRSGEYNEAVRVLPSSVPSSIEYLRLGALAVIHAANGRIVEAVRLGRLALNAASRSLFDSIDAAEVACILAVTLRRFGDAVGYRSFVVVAQKFVARQGATLEAATVALVLNRGPRGGETLLEATEGRGSSNPLDGARFTSGVA